jgi:hypothetical protein
VASKVALDRYGRRIVIQTSCDEVGIRLGETFILIGDAIECVGVGIYFTADRARGRKPTPRERAIRSPTGRPTTGTPSRSRSRSTMTSSPMSTRSRRAGSSRSGGRLI